MSLVYLCVFLLVCICILGFMYVRRHEQFEIRCGAILNKTYYYYYIKTRVPAPRFLFLHILSSDEYNNMHVDDLLPANLCSVTLSDPEQCSQFERFHLRHVQNW